MTNQQVNGRTFQDIKRDFESSQEFGRVIETPVVKSEVKSVKNNDAQVKRYLNELKVKNAMSFVVASFAGLLTLGVVGSIVRDNMLTISPLPACNLYDGEAYETSVHCQVVNRVFPNIRPSKISNP
jgi:hypothetical protein